MFHICINVIKLIHFKAKINTYILLYEKLALLCINNHEVCRDQREREREIKFNITVGPTYATQIKIMN